jgi:transposase-like protein
MTKIEQQEHRRDMVCRYYESGMSQKAFCETIHVPQSTFAYWVKRVRAEREESVSTNSLVPVGSFTSADSSPVMRIKAPSGVVVELDLPASGETIRMVLKAMEGV